MKLPFHCAVLSDVHLGHRKTPTERIVKNLHAAFPDTPETGELDALFITGDFFDRFLNLPDDDVYEIHSFIAYLLVLCKKRDIVLRVLEGTPSHDWKQSRLFESINQGSHLETDSKFVSVLSIEYLERFDMTILYIPDEWRPETEQTKEEVRFALADANLEQVDVTLMHGQFQYQLPEHVQAPCHDPDYYADITRHAVFCGHVHKASRYRNIYVPGSFDRLTHGEEEPKGHWTFTFSDVGNTRAVFHENVNAMPYVSIDVSDLDDGEVMKAIATVADTAENLTHFRVVAGDHDAASSMMDVIRKRWPYLNWTSKFSKGKDAKKITLVDRRATFKTVSITKDSIVELTQQALEDKSLSPEQISTCLGILNEVI